MRIKEVAEFSDLSGKCSFCNQAEATGVWFTAEVVRCCPYCAVKILPALIADSIRVFPGRRGWSGQQTLCEVESTFWRALALRLQAILTPPEPMPRIEDFLGEINAPSSETKQ